MTALSTPLATIQSARSLAHATLASLAVVFPALMSTSAPRMWTTVLPLRLAATISVLSLALATMASRVMA